MIDLMSLCREIEYSLEGYLVCPIRCPLPNVFGNGELTPSPLRREKVLVTVKNNRLYVLL